MIKNIFSKIVLGCALLPWYWAEPAYAQARLRLTETALGPISVATGTNGTAQVIEAYNVGTGTLALTFASNAPWLTAAVGTPRACVAAALPVATCTPITISLNTATLTAGTYTGAITVRDNAAVDAPQTVTVTVQIGGGVPNTLFLYSPPNGASDSSRFFTNSVLVTNKATQTGGDWLDLAYEGQGSFRFVQPYRVSARHLPGMPEGTYNGTLQLGGSTFAGDNKTVQVRFVVTSQPIAFVAPDTVKIKVAQNSQPTTVNVGMANRGRGNLALTGATATVQSGAGWLAAAPATTFLGAAVTLTPGSLAPGTYRGNIALAVNAINGPTINVPVEMEIIASPVPTISFNGVLNNADFKRGDQMGVGAIAAVFGEFLADSIAANTQATLPTTLGNVRVLVNGRAAPLYFVSPGQVNFQMPFETTGGPATVQVERNGVVGNRVSVEVVPTAGRILDWASFGLRHGIIVNSDNTLPIPTSVKIGTFVSKPAKPGDTLVVYCVGFGQTNPPVQTGASSPTSPLAQLSGVLVHFGPRSLFGTDVVQPASFAGLSPGFVGLYQINVQVPEGVTALEDLDFSIQYNGTFTNTVKINTAN
jgi:uncharacterized protein (TIGR03437 family)